MDGVRQRRAMPAHGGAAWECTAAVCILAVLLLRIVPPASIAVRGATAFTNRIEIALIIIPQRNARVQ
jgi:hypothetical protein